MQGMTRIALVSLALLMAAPQGRADHYSDLNRATDRYYRDQGRAGQEYQRDVTTAQRRYYDEMEKARRDYQRDIEREYRSRRGPDWGDIHDAQRDYYRDSSRAERNYSNRMHKAQREYYDSMRKAQERYARAQDRYYRDSYGWEHRGRGTTGGIWDRIVGRRRHHDDWRHRHPYNSQPHYGYDYSNYHWNNGYWNSNYWRGRNQWRNWNSRDWYAASQDDRRVTYWQDNRGGNGYYYPHEDSWNRNWGWNLSVGVGGYTPGYVNYDPYTYGYNGRNSYHYYRNYRNQHRHLHYNNRPTLQLGGSSSYYGDSFFYGNLTIPLD